MLLTKKTSHRKLARLVSDVMLVSDVSNLPAYLADLIERGQKRALNIILPGRSYREALSQLHCSRLDEQKND